MSATFSSIDVRGLQIPNRLWVSPMCQYSAVDGVVGDWHLMHLGSLATGGAGLIIAEATAVSPEGRISIACPGLWNDSQVTAWRRVTSFVHDQSALIGVQLAHAGRKASTMQPWAPHPFADANKGGWEAVAPSAIAFGHYPTPRALDASGIAMVTEDFARAARNAETAGFDVLEIHAAHGYLLHQFMSPLSNQRDDEYGGSFEGRIRLLLEVSAAVRAVSNLPLFVRISATDWTPGGWDLADSVELSRRLKDLGVDLIDVSSGGNTPDVTITVGPGYQVSLAQEIKSGADIPVSAVGLLTGAEQIDSLLASGSIDAVMAARAFMRNPRFALQVAEELGEVVPWPIQVERARQLRP